MGVYSRAARRKVKQALHLNNDEQANKLLDIYTNESKVKAERVNAERLLAIAAPKMEKDLRKIIKGEILLLYAAYQRVMLGYGKKRIDRAVRGFIEFMDEMTREKTTHEQLLSLMKDETGYDFEAHSKELAAEVRR